MNKKILTVTCNPAIDRTTTIKNKKSRTTFSSAGGKGINVSRALKYLGFESLNICLLGGENGESLKAYLRKEKLKFKFS